MNRPRQLPKENPPFESWDFEERTRLPDSELEAAYWWEFAIGLNRDNAVCRAILKARKKLRNGLEIRASPEFKEWARLNALPPDHNNIFELIELSKETEKRFPRSTYVSEEFDFPIRFLIDANNFPATHWQQLGEEEKKLCLNRFSGADRMEERSLCIVPGQFRWEKRHIFWHSEFRESSRLELEILPDGITRCDRWETWRVFHLNWKRSNGELVDDFRQLLAIIRPSDRQDVYTTDRKFKNRTSFREKLKALGAARILQHLNGKSSKALEFAKKHDRKGFARRALPKDLSNWRRTHTNASEFLAEFQKMAFL